MKRIVYFAIALGASTISALAADLPSRKVAPAPGYVPPVFTWSGSYIGANLGFGIGASAFAAPAPLNGTTLVGGLTIGHNWQVSPRVVLGLEADIDYRGAVGGGSRNFLTASSSSAGYLGTVRPRVGLAYDRLLVYATGGLAYGNVIAPKTYWGLGAAGFSGARINKDDTFLPGWTVGGGVEYALSRNWSMKAEYLYAKLKHAQPRYMTDAGLIAALPNTSAIHTFRVGANYRFVWGGGPVVAKY